MPLLLVFFNARVFMLRAGNGECSEKVRYNGEHATYDERSTTL
jgi:hypothetical protein